MAMLLASILTVLRARSRLATAKAVQLLPAVPLLLRLHHLSCLFQRLTKTMTTSVIL